MTYKITVGAYTPEAPGKLDFRQAARVAAVFAAQEAARGADGDMVTVWDGTVEAVVYHPATGEVAVTQEMNVTGEWEYIAAVIRARVTAMNGLP